MVAPGRLDAALQQRDPLLALRPEPPSPSDAAEHRLRLAGVAAIEQPFDGRTNVVEVAVHLGQPRLLILDAADRAVAAPAQRAEPRGVPAADEVGLAGRDEAFSTEQTERLQQAEADVGSAVVGDQQRLVDEVASRSAMSSTATSSPAHTASAASNVQPPANTDSRSNTRCSSSNSNS